MSQNEPPAPPPAPRVALALFDDLSETESEDLLDEGEVIDDRFAVVEKLQSGSFGQVYLATDKLNDGIEVAVKLEKPRPEGKRSLCGHEVEVMRRCRGQKHVPQLYGFSTQPPFIYIAMQLMSFTITELRRSCPSKVIPRFSLNTTILVAEQSFVALKELHAVGVVHRDIKPSNFMLGGTPDTKRCLYLIDFGLSRFYRTEAGDMIEARERPGFVGSTRYASPNAHDGKELGAGDDLMSLLYVVVEMRCGRLPWRNAGDRHMVGAAKRTITFETLCNTLPAELVQIGNLIKPLKYGDNPPYDELMKLLRTMAATHGVTRDSRYDWEENFASVLQEDADAKPKIQIISTT